MAFLSLVSAATSDTNRGRTKMSGLLTNAKQMLAVLQYLPSFIWAVGVGVGTIAGRKGNALTSFIRAMVLSLLLRGAGETAFHSSFPAITDRNAPTKGRCALKQKIFHQTADFKVFFISPLLTI